MNDVKRIPSRVENDTIVEAICEFQLKPRVDRFSQVILGIVYTKLQGEKSIKQTPIGVFPEMVFGADSTLKFQQASSVTWNGYQINFTDFSFVVSCKIPYPRWAHFRAAIIEVLQIVLESGLVEQINRYSVKYTDFLPANRPQAPFEFVELKLSLGGADYSKGNLQLNLEVHEEGILHILTVLNPAMAQKADAPNDPPKTGVLISTDSIVLCTTPLHQAIFDRPSEDFLVELDKLHIANKKFFFNLLSEDGLSVLGPIYG
jgi:uncharacterized protein (TIGR04255 family)